MSDWPTTCFNTVLLPAWTSCSEPHAPTTRLSHLLVWNSKCDSFMCKLLHAQVLKERPPSKWHPKLLSMSNMCWLVTSLIVINIYYLIFPVMFVKMCWLNKDEAWFGVCLFISFSHFRQFFLFISCFSLKPFWSMLIVLTCFCWDSFLFCAFDENAIWNSDDHNGCHHFF